MTAVDSACAEPKPLFGGKRAPGFNSETAKLAALKRYENERVRLLELEQGQASVSEPSKLDEYRLRRLTRVRKQLDKLDAMIQDEIDPQKLDRLASAQAKLAEQERQLSDRSLPPSLRAPTVKTRQSRSGSNSMPEPTPIGE